MAVAGLDHYTINTAEERLKQGAEIAGEEQDKWHAHAWRNLAAIELHLQRPVARDHIRKAIRCHKQDEARDTF